MDTNIGQRNRDLMTANSQRELQFKLRKDEKILIDIPNVNKLLYFFSSILQVSEITQKISAQLISVLTDNSRSHNEPGNEAINLKLLRRKLHELGCYELAEELKIAENRLISQSDYSKEELEHSLKEQEIFPPIISSDQAVGLYGKKFSQFSN